MVRHHSLMSRLQHFLADLQECEARLPGLLKMMLWAQSQLDSHCTFPHITDLMSGTLSDPAAASE